MLKILAALIFVRPFIASLTFVYLNFFYSLAAFGFLAFWVVNRGISLKNISHLRYPLGLFCLALFISIIISSNKLKSLGELYKYLLVILFFLIAASLNYKDRKRIIQAIVLGGFVISLLAIYQYLFGFKHILNYLTKNNLTSSFALDYISRHRVFFPFITPNILGGYLIMIIPLILGSQDKKRKISFYFLNLALISVSTALLLTKSLGALLSLFLGLIIYLYLQGKLKRKGILLLASLLVVIGLIFILRQFAKKEHILPTFSLFRRLDYWRETLRLIKTSPLVGIGLGNFDLAMCRFAHNSYLQIWAEMGILGLISIIWLSISVIKSGLRNIKDSLYKKQIAGLISSSIGFLIQNFVDFSFFLPEVSLIWWVIFGLILSFKFYQ